MRFLSCNGLSIDLGVTTKEKLDRPNNPALHNVYPVAVEFAGKVPGCDWLTEVMVKLPDNLPASQDILLSTTWHTRTSNKARIKIE